jgi:transcriptional regulator with XRE-family HTH domain
MVREARRIHRDLTPDEQSRLQRHREQIAQELPDLIARDRLRKTASAEDTASGALRRAIHKGDLTLTEIADRVGITVLELDQFLTGEATLPSDVFDRLAEAVGCRLVQV